MHSVFSPFAAVQPLASELLAASLQHERLSHAYLFAGQAIESQRAMAMALAHTLNCEEVKAGRLTAGQACGTCRSCKWIQANAHPNVMTISRLTFEPEAGWKDSAKTFISTGQIDTLLNRLSRSSEDVRVVIFTDAEAVPLTEANQTTNHYPLPSEWADEKHTLAFKPLSAHTFNAASANRFLKTLEEPNPNTLFIFLTDSVDSLLDTIVSRCQVIPFQAELKNNLVIPPEASAWLYQWVSHKRRAGGQHDPLAAAKQLQTWCKEEDLSLEQGVATLQRALREDRLALCPDWADYESALRQLEALSSQLSARVNPEAALLQLCS